MSEINQQSILKAHYTDYPMTIKLRNVKNDDGKYKMIPTQSWTKRDETCQPIKTYKENKSMIDNSKGNDRKRGVGMVLERLLIIDLDVGHTENENGKETFGEWINNHDDKLRNKIMVDISNTLRVVTPSGGVHIYFMLPKNKASFTGNRSVGAMSGVDLLTGKNSYVPAPNTQRGDGMYQIYKKSDEYIAVAPQWVLDLFEQASSSTKNKNNSDSKGVKNNGTSLSQQWKKEFSHGYGLYDKYFNRIAEGLKKGERNQKMTSLCGMLKRDIKGGMITKANAKLVVDLVNRNSQPPMSDEEVKSIWHSIIEK